MKRKSGKKKGGKRKKKAAMYESKYQALDWEKLKTVPQINWIARNATKVGDYLEGKSFINESFNKIKEKILEKHSHSCKNLRLFVKDKDDNEKKYLEPVIGKTFQELGIIGDNLQIFYEFEPFVHAMLEAGLV